MTVLPADTQVRSSPAGGFTLVEVVVALSIMSLILLATVTGLRTLANTQRTLDQVTARIDEVRTVSSLLRDLMQSAAVGEGGGGGGLFFGSGTGGSDRNAAFFAITADSLAWKSTVLFGEDFGGSYLVQVARENVLLELRWLEPAAPNQDIDWSLADKRTLVEGVQDFDISWRQQPDQPWQGNWQGGDRVQWVRLQVKAADRYWPELIMQVPQ